MIFGVELLNTEEINTNLYDFMQNIKRVRWLNDFSCLIDFDSDEACVNTYFTLTGSEKIDSNEKSLFNWKEAPKYISGGHTLCPIVRIAEDGDTERKSDKTEAAFYKYYCREEIKNKELSRQEKNGFRKDYRQRDRKERRNSFMSNLSGNSDKNKNLKIREKSRERSRDRSRDRLNDKRED